MMISKRARFRIGQVVHHLAQEFRGVIVDIDAAFSGTSEQLQHAVDTDPDQPWYHLLVDEAAHSAYVPESSLMPDSNDEPVSHPAIDMHFKSFTGGRYQVRGLLN